MIHYYAHLLKHPWGNQLQKKKLVLDHQQRFVHCCKNKSETCCITRSCIAIEDGGCSTHCFCFVLFFLFSFSSLHTAVQCQHTDTPAHTHPICLMWVQIFLCQHLHKVKKNESAIFQDLSQCPPRTCNTGQNRSMSREKTEQRRFWEQAWLKQRWTDLGPGAQGGEALGRHACRNNDKQGVTMDRVTVSLFLQFQCVYTSPVKATHVRLQAQFTPGWRPWPVWRRQS